MNNNYYVTSPIYFYNDEPRLVHAYAAILADVLAGYNRLFGRDVCFLAGTCNHNEEMNGAHSSGLTAGSNSNDMALGFDGIWGQLNNSYDVFIGTTEEHHKKAVQSILQDFYDRQLIYITEYDGWYCDHEERFWLNKDLKDGSCPSCGKPVSQLIEKNYFFRISKYQKWLTKYIRENPGFIMPETFRNEVLGFLKEPLGDLCISRPKSGETGGIELPFDKNYECHVWFDAMINYLSAIGYKSDNKKFQEWWPALHIIGKDILTTHAVYWPCTLEAMKIEQQPRIFVHDNWRNGENKSSGPKENILRPLALADKYGIDILRYFLIKTMAEGQDSTFTEKALISCNNSDLASGLGNLLFKTLIMIKSYSGGHVPQRPALMEQANLNIINSAGKMEELLANKTDCIEPKTIINGILDIVEQTNHLIDKQKPMDSTKVNQDRLNAAIYDAAEVLRLVSVLLSPIMPGKCKAIQRQLGLRSDGPECKGVQWGMLRPKTIINPEDKLFPKKTIPI